MTVIEEGEEEDIRQTPRWRRAWCEITGGHKSAILPAGRHGQTFAVRLHCERCGFLTRWWHVPTLGTDEEKARRYSRSSLIRKAVDAADELRETQRAYLSNRTEENGAAVGQAAERYDVIRQQLRDVE